MSNILLLTAHSIFEYDELRILHRLGHNVLSIGAYLDPANPSDDKRPALPEIPAQSPELRALVADQMVAKSDLPDEVLDWADTVIVNFFTIEAPEGRAGWLTGNWPKFKAHKNRVIWRTAGQSNAWVEAYTEPLRKDGLEIVRYSPKERHIPYFAGEDAMIRFSKDPADWYGWTGEDAVVGNLTQDLAKRGDAVGYWFWQAATDGLPTSPAGPGSAEIGGLGELAYDDMRAYLRRCRAYLYTGTQPAPYTLGLMEAMMTGVPVVSIGPKAYGGDSYLVETFESDSIAGHWSDNAAAAGKELSEILAAPLLAAEYSKSQRQRAIDLFGIDTITEAWRAYLG
jgi:glycosyltransferase involved in cell wall biosynthesis